MRPEDFAPADQEGLIPQPGGRLLYRCLGCGAHHGIDSLLYTCPQCGAVLLIEDQDFDRLKAKSGQEWRRLFDLRRMLNLTGPEGNLPLPRDHGPGYPAPTACCTWARGTPPWWRPIAPAAGPRSDVRLLLQERRPEPLGLFQGPGHGRGAEFFASYLIKYKGAGRILSRLRLHRRHLGRRGPVRRLPGPGGDQRGAPAPGQGDPPAAGPAAGLRGLRSSSCPGCSTTA